MNNTKEIKTLIDKWVVAIQQKNLESIILNHTSDILMFDVPKPLQNKGMEQYIKTWKLFSKYSKGGKDSFKLEELQIYASDTIAFCTAVIKLSKRKKAECRLTVGLKKIRKKWMFVHEHHSAPHTID